MHDRSRTLRNQSTRTDQYTYLHAVLQVYSIEESMLCLTGTAEVPLGGIYMDKVLKESQLPIKMAAFGHCFRTEAGAAGAAGKGLYRVHQFSKVGLHLGTPLIFLRLLSPVVVNRCIYTGRIDVGDVMDD